MRLIRAERDGSFTLDDGTTMQTLAPGSTADQVHAAAAAFFGSDEVRQELPKSLVQERVNTLGLWSAVMNVLMPGGVPTIYYARWFAPDWPNVYTDDAGLLQILQAAGATADQIAQITAPV